MMGKDGGPSPQLMAWQVPPGPLAILVKIERVTCGLALSNGGVSRYDGERVDDLHHRQMAWRRTGSDTIFEDSKSNSVVWNWGGRCEPL